MGTVFVEGGIRVLPGREHVADNCVRLLPDGVVSVINASDRSVEYKSSVVIARGQICCKDQSPVQLPGCSVVTTKCLKPYKMFEITGQLNDELHVNQKQALLDLLNKYRVCFSESTKELGKCDGAEIKIHLKDEKPITFTPYRLSFSEHAQVREIVEDLLKNDIIGDSKSPYAS